MSDKNKKILEGINKTKEEVVPMLADLLANTGNPILGCNLWLETAEQLDSKMILDGLSSQIDEISVAHRGSRAGPER